VNVNIYLESLSYTDVSESVAIDTVTLISNIGGSLGLLLGLCVITAVEAFELAVKLFMVYLRHKKSLTKVENQNNMAMSNRA
jgi:hypothetical protein